jgi:DNA-binding transcriptional LysR family regulator
VEKNVLNNYCDLGFVGSPAHDDRLVMSKLFDDGMVLVLPPDHRWCSRRTIRAEELNDEPFLISKSGSGTGDTLEAHFRQFDIMP